MNPKLAARATQAANTRTDSSVFTGYRVALNANLPNDICWPGEREISLAELIKLDLPLDQIVTIAFCSAGITSRGYETHRHPVQVCATEHGYAIGYAWGEEPASVGRSLVEALDNLPIFPNASIAQLLKKL
jgi:hypothetical protein